MKNDLKNLIVLVDDEEISDDAWGDVFSVNAASIAEKLISSGEFDGLKKIIAESEGRKRLRLVQAVLDSEYEKDFDFFLGLAQKADPELSEVILGNLQNWNISTRQKSALIETWNDIIKVKNLGVKIGI
jgi:hypothetical protein